MPSAIFFQNLGLLVRRDFFDPSLCERLRFEIDAAASEKGSVIKDGPEKEGVVDESTRRVMFASRLDPATEALIEGRLLQLKPSLEEHFGVPLTGFDGPDFLSYGEGAFYTCHRDAGPGAPARILRRRVSVVILLNEVSKEPFEGCYGGGALTFYGLLNGKQWERCAFELEPEPGLLIAFCSDTQHEVKPVTHGRRFTVVAWFVTDSPANASGSPEETPVPGTSAG